MAWAAGQHFMQGLCTLQGRPNSFRLSCLLQEVVMAELTARLLLVVQCADDCCCSAADAAAQGET